MSARAARSHVSSSTPGRPLFTLASPRPPARWQHGAQLGRISGQGSEARDDERTPGAAQRPMPRSRLRGAGSRGLSPEEALAEAVARRWQW